MSVILMGMEMPKSCRECCLEAKGYFCMPIEVQNKDNDVWLRTQYWSDIGERPDWCPLRPFPDKHGRLIDADGMEKLMCDTVLGDIRSYPYNDTTWDTAFQWIDHQPTIVEAEGD